VIAFAFLTETRDRSELRNVFFINALPKHNANG
jgi:hypothetical protein